MKTILCLVLVLSSAPISSARVLKTVEAEACEIVCTSTAPRDAPSQFASGNGMAPQMWGETKGDSIAWEEVFRSAAEGLKLGVRYAFHGQHLENRKGADLPQALVLVVDEHRIEVPMPSTDGWEIFQTVLVELPRLEAGKHSFRLETVADRSDRNVDCFFFVRGELEDIPIGMRQTIVATHRDGFFELWTAPEVVLPLDAQFILESCARIYDFLQDQTVFTPPDEKVRVHIRPDKYVGPHQFQTERGIWFSDHPASAGLGGFCHEMNHLFQPHIPGWMGHPLIRVNDALVLPEALFPEYLAEFRSGIRERQRRGREFLRGNPKTTDDAHTITFALHMRYGPDLQRKFYHILAAERAAGRLGDVTEALTPEQLVAYLSQAAGQDVGRLFKRLDGFPENFR